MTVFRRPRARFLIPGICAGILLALLTGCVAKNINSMQLRGERVEVVPLSEGNKIAPFGVIAAALAPKVIDFTASKLQEFYREESEKYRGVYFGKYVGDDFYKPGGSLELSYPKIEIRRYVSATEKDMERETLASSIILGFDTNTDGTLLTLRPLQIFVEKTKAKLRAGDDDVDISIHFKLNGYWTNKAQDIKSRETADISLLLKNIQLGETYRMEMGESKQSYLVSENGEKSNYNSMSDWFAPVPFSLDDKGDRAEDARGNFVVSIQVTELDDYGQQVAKFGENIDDSSGIWAELAKKLLN